MVPTFLSNSQRTPCPERHKHDGRSKVVRHLTGKLCDIFLGYHMVWWPILSQDTSCLFQTLVHMHDRSVNWFCLVWVHLIKLEHRCRISALQATEHSPLCAAQETSLQLKQNGTELNCPMPQTHV